MPIEHNGINDKAVLWRFAGHGRDGQPKVSDVPEEIDCGWQETDGEEGIDAELVVFAEDEIEVGSVLWHGLLADLVGTLWEDQPDVIMEVVSATATPDIRGVEVRQTLKLRRYRASLPENG